MNLVDYMEMGGPGSGRKPYGTCQNSASSGFGHSGGVPHMQREDCKEWKETPPEVPHGPTSTPTGSGGYKYKAPSADKDISKIKWQPK